MNAYSMDLRQRVWAAWEKQEGTRAQVAGHFGVSLSFVRDLIRLHRDTRSLEPKPHGGGAPRKADAAREALLKELLDETPDATLPELAARISHTKGGRRLSAPTVGRALRRLGYTRKKSSCTPASAMKSASSASAGPGAGG